MRLVERVILERLFAEARCNPDGAFVCTRFACTPATGEDGDEILAKSVADPLDAATCIKFASQWDSNSLAEFESIDRERGFWVLLVWGNKEDVISDYMATAEADHIIGRVTAWIEGKE